MNIDSYKFSVAKTLVSGFVEADSLETAREQLRPDGRLLAEYHLPIQERIFLGNIEIFNEDLVNLSNEQVIEMLNITVAERHGL